MVEHFRIAAYMKEQKCLYQLGRNKCSRHKIQRFSHWLSLQSIGKRVMKTSDYSFLFNKVFEKEIIKRPF
jgi:hypothetical protein